MTLALECGSRSPPAIEYPSDHVLPDDPRRDRFRARQAHCRAGCREARGRDRVAQPLATAAECAEPLRQEITPKNILLIGPTGVGKTEIARRLARLADAPFVKVEATKFTEVGYVGRDVDMIIRDLGRSRGQANARRRGAEGARSRRGCG